MSLLTIGLLGSAILPVFPVQAVSSTSIFTTGGQDTIGSPSENVLQFTSGGHVLCFGQNAVHLAGLDHALRVEFSGGCPVQPSAEGAGSTQNGTTPLRKVHYSGIWQHIDVSYSAAADGIAESTYVIRPGGNPADINLSYNVPVDITANGGLRFGFANGYITESAPVAWQEIEGERLAVAVQFVRRADNRVGFSLGGYNSGYTTYIDPTYSWHTFCGAGGEMAQAIAVDTSGNIYVTGLGSSDYVSGPHGELPRHDFTGAADILVVKLNSSGAYQWHTFYGSTSTDYGESIAVDTSGNIYVAGESSGDWNGSDNTTPLHGYAGMYDITVIGLDSDGYYRWHTFYGSTDDDGAYGIAVDALGNVCVTGSSVQTWDAPTPPKHPHSGGFDTFVLKLNGSGSYQWHTFYGGASYATRCNGIATDGSCYIYVTGDSYSSWNGSDNQTPLHDYAGSIDIFVLKLDGSGDYRWHTFYGSAGDDFGQGIAVDTSGNIFVAGYSDESWNGSDNTTPLHTFAADDDICVLKLNDSGAYQWHSFYGSTGEDQAHGIARDGAGNVYVAGHSKASWKVGADDPLNAFAGTSDIALLGLDSAGAYLWHTFYGTNDYGMGVAVDSSAGVYVTGSSTTSWDGPGGKAPIDPYIPNVVNIVVVKTGFILPTVTTQAATNLTTNSATLNMDYTMGEYNPVDVRFAYKKSTDLNWTSHTSWVSKSAAGSHAEPITGLDSNTTYDFRAEIRYNSSEIQGGALQFTTSKTPAAVTTQAETGLTTSSTTLNMSYIMGDYNPIDVRFAYKKASDAVWIYTAWSLKSAAGTHSEPVAGLDTDVTYDFRAELKYDSTEIQGDILHFTTGKTLPAVTTDAATNITTSSATLNMSYTVGDYSPVDVRFSYKKSADPAWTYTSWVSKPAAGAHSETIAGLDSNTTYNFRAELRYNTAEIQGSILQFTTFQSTLYYVPPSSSSSTPAAPQAPVTLPSIQVQSATLSAAKVSPDMPVTVTADIVNRGTVNGSARIKLYVNGREDSSQGITLESGGNRPLYFTVSRSQPGTYVVYAGGIQAGSFIVEDAVDPNIILVVSCALIFSALVLGLLYILRRQKYSY